MDFKQFVGKQVLWTGGFRNPETDTQDTYIVFDGGVVGLFPDPESGHEPRVLDGLDAIESELADNIEFAKNVLALKDVLEKIRAPKPAPAAGHAETEHDLPLTVVSNAGAKNEP